jgi:hypothetical protein
MRERLIFDGADWVTVVIDATDEHEAVVTAVEMGCARCGARVHMDLDDDELGELGIVGACGKFAGYHSRCAEVHLPAHNLSTRGIA